MLDAFRDSFILLHFRWMLIRSGVSRVVLGLGILCLVVALVAVSNTGSLIKTVATTDRPDLEAAKIFAQSYLLSFQSGDLGVLVSTTLAFAILSVVLAPFTGTSMTSLLPHHQLVSLTRSARHRFSDSVIAQFFSSISLLQLLMVTFVASLLTIDEGRIAGVSYAWVSWTALVLLSCFSVWVSEFVSRKYDLKRQALFMIGAVAVLGVAILLDPNHGRTVFGLGEFYANAVHNFSSYNIWEASIAVAVVALLDVIFLYATYWMCARALAEPERDKTKKKQKTFSRWRASKSPYVELVHTIFSQVWRNPEIRKPLVMVTLFSAASLAAFGEKYSLLTGMILIIPLISALSWGSNMFGMMGSGWVWLSSNPFVRGNIIWVSFVLQVFISFFLFNLMSLPALLLGKVDHFEFISSVLALIVVSVVMSRSALAKSVYRPYPYRAGQRGESALSPATILEYTLRFAGWSGTLGLVTVAVGSAFGDAYVQVLLVAIIVSWAVLRTYFLQKAFVTNPDIQAKIVLSVGSDNN